MRSSSFITLLVGSSLTVIASPALAQSTSEPTADSAATPAEQEREDILVIGTRRSGRTVTDSASPIDVIGSEELQAQPAANMLDVVRNLVPSFFVAQNTISDASTFVRPPSLRGLGADQILVMINGKRYNRAALVQVDGTGGQVLSLGSQGADLANIPSISIGNLQVLRDGATAQYGSDAIGGVINYQLRQDAGFELQGLYGQTYKNDGDRRQVSGYAGFKLGNRGFVALSGEYFKEDGTSRGATRPIAVLLANANPGVAARIPNYPGPAQIWGSSPSDGFKLFLNSSFEVADGIKVYATGNYAESKANQSFNYRSPFGGQVSLVRDAGNGAETVITNVSGPGQNGSFSTIYTTPCPAGNATCPAGGFVRNGGTTFNFTSIYPGGFTPRFIGEIQQFHATAGLKGETESGFTYDLSSTLARNSLALSMTDSLSPSFGPQSQTSFFFGNLIQRERTFNLDVTYPLEAGFASPITLSAGAEHRREQYETTVGDPQSYAGGPFGNQPLYDLVSPGVYTVARNTPTGPQVVATQSPAASGYGGISPTFAGKNSQSSYAIYAGAETDIVKAFSVGVAGRYEHYQTFGGRFVGKANAIYHFSDAVAVRVTAGTGFHAPSPGQNNTQILSTTFAAGTGNQVQTGIYPVTSDVAKYYGAISLKPETSVNFGAGLVLEPAAGLTVTIDGYTIKVDDRIGISRQFAVTAADIAKVPTLASVGVNGVVQYFTNGFDTRTSGVDVVTSYRTRLLDAPFNVTLAYNYNKSTVTDFIPGTIDDARRYDISNYPPEHRANLSASWQLGDFTINGRESFYSSWSSNTDYPGQNFGSKFLTDLDISYTIADHYTLTIGANNLFNIYPDKVAPTSANAIYQLTNSTADGQIYPRSGGPFGINGGFYYARLRIKY